jgi:hypothetical protein
MDETVSHMGSCTSRHDDCPGFWANRVPGGRLGSRRGKDPAQTMKARSGVNVSTRRRRHAVYGTTPRRRLHFQSLADRTGDHGHRRAPELLVDPTASDTPLRERVDSPERRVSCGRGLGGVHSRRDRVTLALAFGGWPGLPCNSGPAGEGTRWRGGGEAGGLRRGCAACRALPLFTDLRVACGPHFVRPAIRIPYPPPSTESHTWASPP